MLTLLRLSLNNRIESFDDSVGTMSSAQVRALSCYHDFTSRLTHGPPLPRNETRSSPCGRRSSTNWSATSKAKRCPRRPYSGSRGSVCLSLQLERAVPGADASCAPGQNLDYNTPGGKLNRGIATVDTVEIVKGSPLDDDEYKRAAILGWCIELVRRGRGQLRTRV